MDADTDRVMAATFAASAASNRAASSRSALEKYLTSYRIDLAAMDLHFDQFYPAILAAALFRRVIADRLRIGEPRCR